MPSIYDLVVRGLISPYTSAHVKLKLRQVCDDYEAYIVALTRTPEKAWNELEIKEKCRSFLTSIMNIEDFVSLRQISTLIENLAVIVSTCGLERTASRLHLLWHLKRCGYDIETRIGRHVMTLREEGEISTYMLIMCGYLPARNRITRNTLLLGGTLSRTYLTDRFNVHALQYEILTGTAFTQKLVDKQPMLEIIRMEIDEKLSNFIQMRRQLFDNRDFNTIESRKNHIEAFVRAIQYEFYGLTDSRADTQCEINVKEIMKANQSNVITLGQLFGKCVVCRHYAYLFKLIFDQLQYVERQSSAAIITSTSHAWVIVQLFDGAKGRYEEFMVDIRNVQFLGKSVLSREEAFGLRLRDMPMYEGRCNIDLGFDIPFIED